MKKILLSMVFYFAVCQNMIFGQVDSKMYNMMLKTLLAHTVTEVSVSDVLAMEEVVLLDAREKEEYEVSHIENAVWIGYDDFVSSRVATVDKDAEIVVYCSVGYRSEKITEKLINLGFTNVCNLYGGMFEWVNQGQAVVEKENSPTQKVHAFDKVWGVWLNIPKENKIYN